MGISLGFYARQPISVKGCGERVGHLILTTSPGRSASHVVHCLLRCETRCYVLKCGVPYFRQ